MSLHIARGLDLPDEAVTETFAVLAKRGRGKTYLASVMAEEMIEAGFPIVVIDPVGVWWGLRSSASGKGEGLPVVIFGGDHADVPLEESAGELIADVVIDRRVPAVIDLSGLSKAASRRFMAPFIERLYHRNRDAMHVIVDEADAFAPQRSQAEGRRLLGAMEDLVRRGRARGIGVTLVTQRPAVLHKDVLTQAEVLIALGMTGPRDVAAIDEWVKLHADEDQARDLKASLPSLPIGTAWVWSPGWLDVLRKVQVRKRKTFDSSATPKPGQRRTTPQRMADVDLTALGEQIAATVERAKAADPKHLHKRIRDLEAELAEALREQPEPEPERIEVPVLPPETAKALRDAVDDTPLVSLLTEIREALVKIEQEETGPRRRRPPAYIFTEEGPGRPVRPTPQPTMPEPDGTLPRAQQRILTVLAQHGEQTVSQVAILTGYSHKSGGFRNSLSTLRTSGYMEGKNPLRITEAGLAALGNFEPLPTGRALLDYWKSTHLGKAEKAIVDVLDRYGGGPVEVPVIAEEAGYSATSGGFRNSLSRLRTFGIASGRTELTLNPELV